jgi:hypothetical protein
MKIATRCVGCDSARLQGRPAVLMPFLANRIFGWTPTLITSDWGLRDAPTGLAYPICRTLMCDACGMLFLDMRFDAEEMAALYEDYRGEAYTATRELFEPGYAARNALYLAGVGYAPRIEAFLEAHLPRAPRVLDWGGDTGVNTPFRGRAQRHDIYDISNRPLVQGARKVDLEQASSGDYDLLVFSNVLEHVSYPRDTLADVVEIMGGETVLYLEVPFEDIVRLESDPLARLAGKRHWHEHINFFTPDALDALLAGAGLQELSRVTMPMSAGGKDSVVVSIAARLTGKPDR